MKIYLAHNFSAREYLKELVTIINQFGHVVTSRWIFGATEDKIVDSVMDLADIDEASSIVFFPEQFGDSPGRGKYFELGYAMRAGKRCVLFGDRKKYENECVFYALPNMRWAKTIEEVLTLV